MNSTYKKDLALFISRFVPIRIKKGIAKGSYLHGRLFYNRRASKLNLEERIFKALPQDVESIIDIGAHIGVYSIYFGSQFPKAKVLAFEPNPQNYFFLTKNLIKNNIKNVRTFQLGIAEKSSIRKFISDKYVTGKGSFCEDKQNHIKLRSQKIIEEEIRMCSLDDILAVSELTSIDFLKIDTEGFETNVIKGAQKVLHQFDPVLYYEIHGLSKEQKLHDSSYIYDNLKSLGYHVYCLAAGQNKLTDLNCKEHYKGAFMAFRSKNSLGHKLLQSIQN